MTFYHNSHQNKQSRHKKAQHQQKNILKKIILSLSIALSVSVLSACNSTSSKVDTSEVSKTNLGIGKKNWQTDGLEQPESVVFDASNQIYYVSNISGKPTELNGKGFISRVATNGDLLQKRWVTGMNAPKGMAQHGNLLFVADMQQLHIIDIAMGRITKTITEQNSKMLNDISIDEQGNVYISDLLDGGIYKLDHTNINQPTATLEKWITAESLPLTNGVLVDGKRLLVATWGKDMQADFSTKELGGLYSVDIASKRITPLVNAQKIGNLDGIVKVGSQIIVNDWINGNIFSYQENSNNQTAKTSTLFSAEKTSADIGTDGTNLLVPVMMQNKLISYELQ